MTDNNSDSIGQSLGAIPGSRERGQEVVPALTGFDPARNVVEFIASKLGKAQRRVIMSLTEDWGKAACHQTARRMFYGVTANRYTVVHHKHRTDNCWCLSNLGASVKAELVAETPPYHGEIR